jgi:DNA-binding transcriptional LysR family regulator
MDMETLKRMAIFSRVVEAGGFSAAARQIGLAKSAVSKHIMELERHIGVKLLNRTTRRLSLTEAGNLYYEACARLVTEATDATNKISGLSEQLTGSLRVSCPLALGNDYLVPVITAFADIYPDLKIELLVDDQVVNMVEEGIDVAIRIGWLADSTLIARKLTESPRLLCASPSYIEKYGTPKHPQDLVKHQWVVFTLLPTPYRQTLKKKGQQQTISVNGRFKTNNAVTLRSLLLAGNGIGVLSEFMVTEELRKGKLVHLLSDYDAGAAGVYAVYPNKHYQLSKVHLFITYLNKHLHFG